MFRTLPFYPLMCPDCNPSRQTWRCINFWDAVWQCDVCNQTTPVHESNVAYRALPPTYVPDFPYPPIESDRHE